MRLQDVRWAYDAGLYDKEAVAFHWALDYFETHQRLPFIKEVQEGVTRDMGIPISRGAAHRGYTLLKRYVGLA